MRAISSSVTPIVRAIATCWPHSYGARQFQPVRRISSSRSRAGSVLFASTWLPNTIQRFINFGWCASVAKMLSGLPVAEERAGLVVPFVGG